MGPGLARMLDMITKAPADTMLVDRFLVLASDIPEFDRAEATLKLARALTGDLPRRSLEIAWMVYKSGLKDSEALQVVCDALEKINRPNKAQLIRAELRRIANMKISPEARGKARQTIEDQVTTTLAGSGDVPVSDTAEVTRSELLPLIVDELHDVQKSSQINSDQEPPPKDSAVDQSKADEPVKHSGKITFLDPVDAAKVARISRAANSEVSDGIPEAIPPKEPSRHLSGVRAENDLSIATRFSVRRDGATPNSSSETKYSAHRSALTLEERRQRLQELVKAEEWESVLEMLSHSFSDAKDVWLLELFEKGQLSRIDVRFAGWWVDILTAVKQERRAFRFILKKLSQEPHLAWARALWPKILVIVSNLDLEPIHWREGDGVLALREKVAGLAPRGGCYWVSGNPKAS